MACCCPVPFLVHGHLREHRSTQKRRLSSSKAAMLRHASVYPSTRIDSLKYSSVRLRELPSDALCSRYASCNCSNKCDEAGATLITSSFRSLDLPSNKSAVRELREELSTTHRALVHLYKSLNKSYCLATLEKNSSGVCAAATRSVPGCPKAIQPSFIDLIICS